MSTPTDGWIIENQCTSHPQVSLNASVYSNKDYKEQPL